MRSDRQQPELQLTQHWHDGKDTHLGLPLRGAQCGLDQTRVLHRGAVEAAEAGAVHLPPLDLHAGGGGQPLPIPEASWQLEHYTTVAQAGQLGGMYFNIISCCVNFLFSDMKVSYQTPYS